MRSKVTRWGALLLVIGASLGFAAPVSQATPSNPNDPAFHLQWNLGMIGAPSAWQVATGSGSTIAVVDSGVDLNHEDLAGQIIGHADCVGAGNDPPCKEGGTAGQDDNGHGTHVAGIASARTDNGTGVAGVAPDASILVVKVLEQSCDTLNGCTASGTASDVAAGIRFAADAGAEIINLSLGNTSQSIFGPAFQEALTYAFNKGSIPVLAAGNDFLLPSGGAADAIVVGAVQRDGTRAAYSNIGTSGWSISAPGGSLEGDSEQSCKEAPQAILSTYLNGYACVSGTSMAAPHVSGAAAVLRGFGYSQQDTVARLLATARPAGPGTGAGALDLAAAVGAAPTPPPDSTPAEQTTAPGAGGGGEQTNSSDNASTASTPAGDLGEPTSTSPAGVITVPSQRAAAAAPGRVTTRSTANDDLSPGLVAVAVLMAAGVGCAAGWFALRGPNLARRTPPV